ncbi:MAG: hypothetical protein KJ667_02155 [Alphaproteobacteria bacterium]|nr:hypothetical protein [Alphaproteobacteria bacterium]
MQEHRMEDVPRTQVEADRRRSNRPFPVVVVLLAFGLVAAWALFFGAPIRDSLDGDSANPQAIIEPAAGMDPLR